VANNRRRKDIYRLPHADQKVLEDLGYKQKLDEVDQAILANAEFLGQIVASPEIFGHDIGLENDEADESASPTLGQGNGRSPGLSHSHSHSHSHSSPHLNEQSPTQGKHIDTPQKKYKPSDFDMDKLRSTLKQFVRDWSEEGTNEREACYRPMKEALLQHFANIPSEER